MKLTKKVARKVLEIVDAGLCVGAGEPKAGRMCVEAAVCYALGLPHGDNPPCVGRAVRSFKIRLNDSAWSSNEARARGLRKLAVAQLGSEVIDQGEFGNRVALLTIQRIVPLALRAAARMKGNDKFKDGLESAAVACEKASNSEEGCVCVRNARQIARSATAAAATATAAAATATAAAAAAAAYADAAAAAAYAAAAAAAYAAAAAAAYAADAADAAAADAADTAAYAYAADARGKARDEVWTVAADLALEVLVKMKAPGCKWLSLCEAVKA